MLDAILVTQENVDIARLNSIAGVMRDSCDAAIAIDVNSLGIWLQVSERANRRLRMRLSHADARKLSALLEQAIETDKAADERKQAFPKAMAAFDAAKTIDETRLALANLMCVARECKDDGRIDDDEFQNVLALVQEFLEEEH
jgi:uncharacterized pyridoxal phosphate-containing UPF0001 family protein